MGASLFWHAAFDTALVAAILGYEMVSHRDTGKTQRAEMMQKLLQLSEQKKLDLSIDPDAKGASYYQAAQALISGQVSPDKIAYADNKTEIPVHFSTFRNGNKTDFAINLSMQELQMVVASAHQLVDGDVAALAALTEKSPIRLRFTEAARRAADHASAMVDAVPGNDVNNVAHRGRAANDNLKESAPIIAER